MLFGWDTPATFMLCQRYVRSKQTCHLVTCWLLGCVSLADCENSSISHTLSGIVFLLYAAHRGGAQSSLFKSCNLRSSLAFFLLIRGVIIVVFWTYTVFSHISLQFSVSFKIIKRFHVLQRGPRLHFPLICTMWVEAFSHFLCQH